MWKTMHIASLLLTIPLVYILISYYDSSTLTSKSYEWVTNNKNSQNGRTGIDHLSVPNAQDPHSVLERKTQRPEVEINQTNATLAERGSNSKEQAVAIGKNGNLGEDDSRKKDDGQHKSVPNIELCPEISPYLVGNITIDMHPLAWKEVNNLHQNITPGGLYTVQECKSRHHVAIVIPYRDRDSHLRVFLHHMIPILIRQQVEFGIYVIEQLPGSEFNRGMLKNVGFVEALKRAPYPCFVFSDVDLWPENDRNIYGCPDHPRLLSVLIGKFDYDVPVMRFFGGVVNFRKEDFQKTNGYSNWYFGWGAEDDDLYKRVVAKGLHAIRPPLEYARYTMAKHKQDDDDNRRRELLKICTERIDTDGVSSLMYKVASVQIEPLYTRISVLIDQNEVLKNVTFTHPKG